MRLAAPKDVLCGLMFAGVGLFFLWLSYDYRMGSAVRMGPGYMPWWLGLLLILLGLAVAGRGLVRNGPRLERPGLRPLLIIVAAVALFGLTVTRAGLIIATLVLVGLSSLAMSERAQALQVAATAAALAAFSALVFVVGLGVPIPLLPRG
jgi:hypothetical protein